MGKFFERLLEGQYNKFIVALAGALAIAVSEGLLPEEVNAWATIVVGFFTSIGVFGIKNHHYQGEHEKE